MECLVLIKPDLTVWVRSAALPGGNAATADQPINHRTLAVRPWEEDEGRGTVLAVARETGSEERETPAPSRPEW